MKRYITRILALVAVVFTLAILSSCRKGGINGELDGQWRVLTVEDLSTGTVTEPTDIFYCFYLHTVNLSHPTVFATGIMTYSGTSLTLEFPYFPANYNEGALLPWGIYD
ncbi:MAG: lipocalin-like domain-containing protein, partial [Paramuribaculum sp.]|nr:lipocalin-like domain-containing protein [Paramuribaculum sp.]